jgi:Tfp pilus assembly protein PilX
VTAISAWYVAIYDNNHTPASNNTYATPGFTEATNFSEATRPAWTKGSVTNRTLTNTASKASFTFSSAATIYGAALVGGGTAATTKGNVAGGGKLFNISAFSSGSKAMASSDVLKVTVALTAQDV